MLLISLGSAYTRQPDFYRRCLEAYGDLTGWHVVLQVGKYVDPDELGRIPDNVEVHSWVPQSAILEQADAFVTHAGMGGSGEGLYNGVPMIAVPQGAEQFMNADRLVELGVARRIDTADATAVALRTALTELVTDPEVVGARHGSVPMPGPRAAPPGPLISSRRCWADPRPQVRLEPFPGEAVAPPGTASCRVPSVSRRRIDSSRVSTVPATAQAESTSSGPVTALPLKYAIERATQVAGAGWQGGADRSPEVRQHRQREGAARARVARDHDDEDGQADADDAGERLQGERDHADREDDQGAQACQRPHAARERAEHRADDDRAADAARDRVQRHHRGTDHRALPVGGLGARADRQDRGAEVAADAPAHDQVERGEAVEVVRGGRGHVHGPYRALLRPLRLLDDLCQ